MRLKSIVYLRSLAAVFIFVCHALLIAGAFEASVWLNVGVPIFFIISAYLFSLKTDVASSAKSFFCKRFKSIFPSYWIYLIIITVVLFAIGRGPDLWAIISFGMGLSGLTATNILGMGHLWFISVLLICYLITPLLGLLCSKLSGKKLAIATITIILGQAIVWLCLNYPAYGIHIGGYIFVFVFYKSTRGFVSKYQLFFWGVLAIAFSVLRLVFDPIFMNMEYEIYYYYDAIFQPIARFCLAMCLFAIFVYYSERIEKWSARHHKFDRTISKFSDASYEVYLTHQFILLAIWEFFPAAHSGAGLAVWAISAFVLTLVNTWALVYIKNFISNKSLIYIK